MVTGLNAPESWFRPRHKTRSASRILRLLVPVAACVLVYPSLAYSNPPQLTERPFRWPAALTFMVGREWQSAAEILAANGITAEHPNFNEAIGQVVAVLREFERQNPGGGDLPTEPLKRIIEDARSYGFSARSASPSEWGHGERGFQWPTSLTLVRGREWQSAVTILVHNGITPRHPNFVRTARRIEALLIEFGNSNQRGGQLSTEAIAKIIRESAGIGGRARVRQVPRTQPSRRVRRVVRPLPPAPSRQPVERARVVKASSTPGRAKMSPVTATARRSVAGTAGVSSGTVADSQAKPVSPVRVEEPGKASGAGKTEPSPDAAPPPPQSDANGKRSDPSSAEKQVAMIQSSTALQWRTDGPEAIDFESSRYRKAMKTGAVKLLKELGAVSPARICRNPASEDWSLMFCRNAGKDYFVVKCVWNWSEYEWSGFSIVKRISASERESYVRSGGEEEPGAECVILTRAKP